MPLQPPCVSSRHCFYAVVETSNFELSNPIRTRTARPTKVNPDKNQLKEECKRPTSKSGFSCPEPINKLTHSTTNMKLGESI